MFQVSEPDLDLFEPFNRLVDIDLEGETVQVPENNTLLRCFQYLSNEGVAYGDFCWNGDCANCQIRYQRSTEDRERAGLACRLVVSEGMKIPSVSKEVDRSLRRQSPGVSFTTEGLSSETRSHLG